MKIVHKDISFEEIRHIVLYKYCEDEYTYFYQSCESYKRSEGDVGQWNIYPCSKLIYKNK